MFYMGYIYRTWQAHGTFTNMLFAFFLLLLLLARSRMEKGESRNNVLHPHCVDELRITMKRLIERGLLLHKRGHKNTEI